LLCVPYPFCPSTGSGRTDIFLVFRGYGGLGPSSVANLLRRTGFCAAMIIQTQGQPQGAAPTLRTLHFDRLRVNVRWCVTICGIENQRYENAGVGSFAHPGSVISPQLQVKKILPVQQEYYNGNSFCTSSGIFSNAINAPFTDAPPYSCAESANS
jgi:hypothetical protein